MRKTEILRRSHTATDLLKNTCIIHLTWYLKYGTLKMVFVRLTYELSDTASNISEQYAYNQDGTISSVYYRYDSGSVNFDVQNLYSYSDAEWGGSACRI